jgi:hypothetical protein
MRQVLAAFWFIHLMVFLGLFALIGYLITTYSFLLFFVALSFSGAVCGAFIKVIDTVKNSNGTK